MRYVIRANRPLFVETPLWEDQQGMVPDLVVDGEKDIDTGLVTATGDAIHRLPPPIGFGRDSDW